MGAAGPAPAPCRRQHPGCDLTLELCTVSPAPGTRAEGTGDRVAGFLMTAGNLQ